MDDEIFHFILPHRHSCVDDEIFPTQVGKRDVGAVDG